MTDGEIETIVKLSQENKRLARKLRKLEFQLCGLREELAHQEGQLQGASVAFAFAQDIEQSRRKELEPVVAAVAEGQFELARECLEAIPEKNRPGFVRPPPWLTSVGD